MLTTTTRRFTLLTCALALFVGGALILTGSLFDPTGTAQAHHRPDHAGGPGGGNGGVPPGVIYFAAGGLHWSMLPDGSDKMLEPFGEPSQLVYGDNGRWFLQFVGKRSPVHDEFRWCLLAAVSDERVPEELQHGALLQAG